MQGSLEVRVERAPVGWARVSAMVVCFLIVLMDGLDTQTIGFNAVAIAKDSGIPIAEFGQIFSAGLLGAALGAVCLGAIGDRVGREAILIVSVVLFAVSSFVLPRMNTVTLLLICRFITGVGLGGALPNLLAVCAEIVPRRVRGAFTGVLFAGIPTGGFVGAVLTAHVAPKLGWAWVFYIGGGIPLVMALPMTAVFIRRRLLARRNRAHFEGDMAGFLRGTSDVGGSAHDRPLDVCPSDIQSLIGKGPTLLLWAVSLLCFTVIIDVALWTAPLLRQQGVPGTTTALIAGAFNLGSVLGTGFGGYMLNRYPAHIALPGSFIVGAVAVCLLGRTGGDTYLLITFALLSGACIGSASAQLLAI